MGRYTLEKRGSYRHLESFIKLARIAALYSDTKIYQCEALVPLDHLHADIPWFDVHMVCVLLMNVPQCAYHLLHHIGQGPRVGEFKLKFL